MRLPTKDPAEWKLVAFEFGTDITTAGTTIASVDLSVTVTVGTDPASGSLLQGAPTIDNGALAVLVLAGPGVAGCEYEIRVLARASDGQRHLVVATLPVAVVH